MEVIHSREACQRCDSRTNDGVLLVALDSLLIFDLRHEKTNLEPGSKSKGFKLFVEAFTQPPQEIPLQQPDLS